MKILSLSYCGLNDKNVQLIAGFLKENKTLEALLIDNNPLCDIGCNVICKALLVSSNYLSKVKLKICEIKSLRFGDIIENLT